MIKNVNVNANVKMQTHVKAKRVSAVRINVVVKYTHCFIKFID